MSIILIKGLRLFRLSVILISMRLGNKLHTMSLKTTWKNKKLMDFLNSQKNSLRNVLKDKLKTVKSSLNRNKIEHAQMKLNR